MGVETEYGISAPSDPGANPVVLSAQVVNAYGVEFGDRYAFADLLRACAYVSHMAPTFSLRGGTREILRGMLLTRAVDNRMKAFFLNGEVKYSNVGFQGKGFRSLGQEAIYACAIRLKRGAAFRDGRSVFAREHDRQHPLCLLFIPRRFTAIGQAGVVVIDLPENGFANLLVVAGPVLRPLP